MQDDNEESFLDPVLRSVYQQGPTPGPAAAYSTGSMSNSSDGDTDIEDWAAEGLAALRVASCASLGAPRIDYN